ncbi:MAG TPA: XkdF-like putative serine protease domain-containing protein [Stellaceae bacterium]|jgi:HK97 family phage prohead protease|nr:XkdF-like putative serine protease domain-containing protein [Stellaceae bacterium]
MKLFAPIAKIDETQHLVFGYASTETLDSQGEIVRKEAIEAALPDYMRFANIREMHQPSAVGVAREAALDDKGLHLAAKIVDDEAWQKIVEGVYKGFSIGGRVTARDPDAKHVITGVDLLEISLVDRPANPEAVIELYKSKPADDAIKVGARHSRDDLARVQQMHDVAVELGADCPGEPHKLAHADALAKLTPLGDQLAQLTKRIEVLEAQPMPPRAMAKAVAVSKEQDGGGGGAAGETIEDFVTRLQGLPADRRALELTKLALRFPRPLPR